MSVSFDPDPVHLPYSIEAISADERRPFVTSNGISDTPSSMVSYDPSGDAQAELFDWLKCLFKGVFFLDETPLDKRIQCGKQVLHDHFSNCFSIQVDLNDFVVVVVMKYNNQILVPFGTLNKRTHLEAFTQLTRLLSNDANWNCENGKLEIKTLLLEKDNDRSIEVQRCSTSIQFGDGVAPSIDWDNSHYEVNADVNAELTQVIPSVEERKKVLDFVSRL